MADYNNIEDNTHSDNGVKELLQLFSIKCQKNQVQTTFKNLIDYLKVYSNDSTLRELEFDIMQLEVENVLKNKFNLSDTVTYDVSLKPTKI